MKEEKETLQVGYFIVTNFLFDSFMQQEIRNRPDL